ncbi:MAG: hypothetical protein P1V19_23695, partial [Gimesia sp.]|nr:hypothetical protein [Gimesia sp.]
MAIPQSSLLKQNSKAVLFTYEELIFLGIDLANLKPFVLLENDLANLSDESMFRESLERRPIIRTNQGIIVTDPTNICFAATSMITSTTGKLMGSWGDQFFEIECASFFVNEIVESLKVVPIQIDLPAAPASLPCLCPYTGQFDYGKPVLSLALTVPISGNTPKIQFSPEQVSDFESYLKACCEALESTQGFAGGLILLGVTTLEKEVSISFAELPENWEFFSANLCEWQYLRNEAEFDIYRLWKLNEQSKRAQELNVEISNYAGLINLYAYWKANDFLLIPHDADINSSTNLISFDGKFSHRLVHSINQRRDLHGCLDHHKKTWTQLIRFGDSADLENE